MLLLSAYPNNELTAMSLHRSHLIREREKGYTFDMTQEEAEKLFPWLPAHFNGFGHFYTRFPGGQSQADLVNQVYLFIEHLNRECAGKKVLIVSHGHTIRALRFILESWTPEQYNEYMDSDLIATPNCGVTTYCYSPESRNLELETANQILWQ